MPAMIDFGLTIEIEASVATDRFHAGLGWDPQRGKGHKNGPRKGKPRSQQGEFLSGTWAPGKEKNF
jgi:hypothetical protein